LAAKAQALAIDIAHNQEKAKLTAEARRRTRTGVQARIASATSINPRRCDAYAIVHPRLLTYFRDHFHDRPPRSHRTAPYYSAISTALLAMTFSMNCKDSSTKCSFSAQHLRRKSLSRYAPEKWSIRQMWGHVNDTERVFLLRALWFARNFETALPSFDQDIAVAAAHSDAVSWRGTWKNSVRCGSRLFRSSEICRKKPAA